MGGVKYTDGIGATKQQAKGNGRRRWWAGGTLVGVPGNKQTRSSTGQKLPRGLSSQVGLGGTWKMTHSLAEKKTPTNELAPGKGNGMGRKKN